MGRQRSFAILCGATMLVSAVTIGSAVAQTSEKASVPAAASIAEAQRKYDIAVATAEAQRRYEIAVATAEAQRRYEIAKAQAGQSRDASASTTPAPQTARGSEVTPSRSRPATPFQANEARLDEIAGSLCEASATSAEAIARGPNLYANRCLGYDEWRDYPVGDLNATLSIGSANDVAEVLGSYSIYKRRPRGASADRFSFTRWQLRGGPLVPVDKTGGTTAAFADLTESQPFKRVGGLLGVESRSATVATTTADLTTSAQKMLAKAQRDCEAERTATILALAGDSSVGAPQSVSDGCRGSSLQTWMANDSRRDTYWSMIANDLWGKKPKSEFFFGVEGRLLPLQLKYVPIRDTALTGDVLLTGSPFDLSGTIPEANMRKFDKARYSLKLYGGGVEGNFGWGGSLTYRRVIDQPKGTRDATLCPPLTPTVCTTAHIARPYESTGWVFGGRLGIKIPRLFFFPEAGVNLGVSYAADLNQIGFDAPLYLLADKDGKATGGLRLGCTGDGKTNLGYVIKGECKASVFIGTNFTLRGAP